jgi:hypothetical protein
MSSDAQTPQLPRRVDGFVLLRELGRGGMGVVYEAEQQAGGRRVALKVLSPELEYSDEAYARFEREARLAASISHPRCVFVLGAHELEGSPAISMELMTGETLQDRIEAEGAFAPARAIEDTLHLLEGLEAAQRVGVIHRDVKPGNCFFAPDGQLKIGDFGLSRSLVADTSLTQAGQFLGSPMYASPEQVRGEAVDVRSDVYSVGATLHHMLSGKPPFEGSGFGEILSRILTEAPAPLPDVPRALERVVRRAMEKDPARRYADHAALTAALRALSAVDDRPAPLSRRLAAGGMDVMAAMFVPGLTVELVVALPGMSVSEDGQLASGLELAAMVILFAYIPAMDAWRGRTFFKQLMGLRVVAVGSGRHERGRAWGRAAVFVGMFVIIPMAAALSPNANAGLALGWLVVGVGLFFSTARPRNQWRMLHEVLSGTVVVERIPPARADAGAIPAPSRPPVEGQAPELGAYEIQGLVAPTVSGRWLLGRDPKLGRAVWIHETSGPPAVGGEPASASAATPSPLALRRLEEFDSESSRIEVYECPGGVGLAELEGTEEHLDWRRSGPLLCELAEELTRDRHLTLDRCWIDERGHLRTLDHPIAPGSPRRDDPLEVLADATRLLLPDDEVARRALPLHADHWLARVQGQGSVFERAEVAGRALRTLQDGPTEVTGSMRRKALISSAGMGLGGALLSALLVALIGFLVDAVSLGWLEVALIGPVVLAVASSALLRGGFGMRSAGIGLRDARGRKASRGRCALRALMVWLPAVLLGWSARGLAVTAGLGDEAANLTAIWVGVGGLVVMAVVTVVAERTLQDRLAGTYPVAR